MSLSARGCSWLRWRVARGPCNSVGDVHDYPYLDALTLGTDRDGRARAPDREATAFVAPMAETCEALPPTIQARRRAADPPAPPGRRLTASPPMPSHPPARAT